MPLYSSTFRGQVKAAYMMCDEPSKAQVAKQFNITPNTMGTWVRKYGWERQRQQAHKEANKLMREACVEAIITNNQKYMDAWDLFYGFIEATLQDLQKKSEEKDEPVPLATISQLATVLTRVQKGHNTALGLTLAMNDRQQKKLTASTETDEENVLDLSDEQLQIQLSKLEEEKDTLRKEEDSPPERIAAAAGG